MVSNRANPAARRWIIITIVIAVLGFCALFLAIAIRTPARNAGEMSASAQDSAGRFLLELFAPLRQNPGADCVVRVQDLADAITTGNGYAPVHVSVSRDSTINAVSLPGRRVVVFEGLLDIPEGSPLREWTVWTELPEHFRELCAEIAVPCLDLTPSFRDAAASGRMVYARTDTHWSAWGHDLAATEIAKLLQELGWPEAPPRPRATPASP